MSKPMPLLNYLLLPFFSIPQALFVLVACGVWFSMEGERFGWQGWKEYLTSGGTVNATIKILEHPFTYLK